MLIGITETVINKISYKRKSGKVYIYYLKINDALIIKETGKNICFKFQCWKKFTTSAID